MKIGQNATKAPKMLNIISFDDKELPDIKNWTPGQKYRLVIDVEQTGLSLGGYDAADSGTRANFKVLNVKPQYGGGAPKSQGNGKPPKSATMSALQRKVV